MHFPEHFHSPAKGLTRAVSLATEAATRPLRHLPWPPHDALGRCFVILVKWQRPWRYPAGGLSAFPVAYLTVRLDNCLPAQSVSASACRSVSCVCVYLFVRALDCLFACLSANQPVSPIASVPPAARPPASIGSVWDSVMDARMSDALPALLACRARLASRRTYGNFSMVISRRQPLNQHNITQKIVTTKNYVCHCP